MDLMELRNQLDDIMETAQRLEDDKNVYSALRRLEQQVFLARQYCDDLYRQNQLQTPSGKRAELTINLLVGLTFVSFLMWIGFTLLTDYRWLSLGFGILTVLLSNVAYNIDLNNFRVD